MKSSRVPLNMCYVYIPILHYIGTVETFAYTKLLRSYIDYKNEWVLNFALTLNYLNLPKCKNLVFIIVNFVKNYGNYLLMNFR